MKVAIHQPNFMPWTGFFHKISLVDCFVFFDDVQMERGKTYTQRTKILVGGKEMWLTVPVINKSDLIIIKDAQVDTSFVWKRKLLKTIELNYKNTPGFEAVFSIIEKAFATDSTFLIDYNIPLITGLSAYLGLDTRFVLSSEIEGVSDKTGKGKILEINKCLKADAYVSGSGEGSKRYIEETDYIKNGISLEWQKYCFKEYPQVKSSGFIPGLSVIDLLFNCGDKSLSYLRD